MIRRKLVFFVAILVDLSIIVVAAVGIALPRPEAVPGPGLLRVTGSPGIPAQILVDGQIADSGGLQWLKLAPGTHTLCFNHVEGWSEPACQIVAINRGMTKSVTGTFTQRGWLRVVTSPAVPSQITLDGNPADGWSMWTDVVSGPHTVCFGKVLGYDPPGCQKVMVLAGSEVTVKGIFSINRAAQGQRGTGVLRVLTSPAVRSQILITPEGHGQYIADSWGLNGLELPVGVYTVSFNHVQGYTEPVPKHVMITAGNITTLTGIFIQRGVLKVSTWPPAAGTILVDDVPRDDWSMSTEFPAGSHLVCFGQATGFAATPPCQSVSIAAGAVTNVIGMYR